MYSFKETDINRLIEACNLYKENTGSEYMWEEYDSLIGKLKTYLEQNFPDGREKNI